MEPKLELPTNIEAEDALLGAILNNPELINGCKLEPQHFFDWKNRDVFEVMRNLIDAKKPANYYVVGEALQNKKAFEDVFVRLDYLRSCYYFQKSFEQLEFLILEAYRKRTAINELQEEFVRLFKPEEYTDRVFADMVAKITKISDPLLSEAYSLDEMMKLIAMRAANPTKIYGLETGLYDFDLQTHGLQKKEVFILLGEPGSGKSMLAAQLALGMAEHKNPGVFYSLEMSAEAIYMRWLSAKTGISTDRIKEGWEMVPELEKIEAQIEKIASTPITIREQALWTPIKLRADIANLKMKNNIQFAVIDYLDLLQDPGANDKIEKSENLIIHLSNLAKEFDIAILTIQSLVKSGFGGSPTLHDISGSAKVSYTVDNAAVLVGNPEEKIKELRWIKSRHSDDAKTLKLMLKPGLPEFSTVAETEPDGGRFTDWSR